MFAFIGRIFMANIGQKMINITAHVNLSVFKVSAVVQTLYGLALIIVKTLIAGVTRQWVQKQILSSFNQDLGSTTHDFRFGGILHSSDYRQMANIQTFLFS